MRECLARGWSQAGPGWTSAWRGSQRGTAREGGEAIGQRVARAQIVNGKAFGSNGGGYAGRTRWVRVGTSGGPELS
jgi:hypothetical protein